MNKTKYRNQINKIALAIKEIFESMRVSGSSNQSEQEDIQIKERKEKNEIKIEESPGKDTFKSK